MINRQRSAVGALALSALAFVGMAVNEGYKEETYLDSVKVPTNGFGTTEGVKLGEKVSVETALVRALKDASKFEGAVKKCVTVPLHQYEYDAYVRFSYNVGSGAFCSSTLVKKLNAMDYEGACAELSRWNMAGGKVLNGLTKRRAEERSMCEGR